MSKAGRPKEVKSEARERLTAKQIIFAEWLAMPSRAREPRLQQALAAQLSVSEQTICRWKRIPEVVAVRNEIANAAGVDLVPEAIQALREELKKGGQYTIKAAESILDRYGEVAKGSQIATTLRELIERFK